jgi:23S rRNA pseudouridine1911/1915/1917 synthase
MQRMRNVETDGAGVIALDADRGDAGARLDHVICRHLAHTHVSRTRVQTWIGEGRVMVNGAAVRRPAARVASGDTVVLSIAPRVRRAMAAEARTGIIDVLFEDDHLLVVNKPPGIVVHPTVGNRTGTMMNALLWHAREWRHGQKPALVGRLDKDTSGVLLVSKRVDVHAALQRATASGAGDKSYLALVYGHVKAARGTIDLPLAPDPSDRRRTVAGARGALPSVTRFERIGRAAAAPVGLTLLRCSLGSGRRHQIRAHLMASGWPIVGDPVYGGPRWRDVADATTRDILRAFPRQALHALRLAFTHPVTGERVDIVAPPPKDLAAMLDALMDFRDYRDGQADATIRTESTRRCC